MHKLIWILIFLSSVGGVVSCEGLGEGSPLLPNPFVPTPPIELEEEGDQANFVVALRGDLVEGGKIVALGSSNVWGGIPVRDMVLSVYVKEEALALEVIEVGDLYMELGFLIDGDYYPTVEELYPRTERFISFINQLFIFEQGKLVFNEGEQPPGGLSNFFPPENQQPPNLSFTTKGVLFSSTYHLALVDDTEYYYTDLTQIIISHRFPFPGAPPDISLRMEFTTTTSPLEREGATTSSALLYKLVPPRSQE